MSNQTEAPPARALPPKVRRKMFFAGGLLAIYSAIYFVAALLTSVQFADLAATLVLGLPVALWAGWAVLVGGVVITRIYLNRYDR